MKKLYILILIFISINIKAQTGTNIFSYGTNGEVIASNTFLSSRMEWNNSWPLNSDTSFILNSADKQNAYKISLSKVGTDPSSEGHFNSIRISNAGNSEPIIALNNANDWCNAKLWSHGVVNAEFIVIQLSERTMALIFTGWRYDSTPLLTTIVVLKDGKATLVFNRNCNVLDFQQDAAHFSFTYANEYQEYYGKSDKPYPSDKDLKKFKVWKEGDLLKYAALN